MGEGLNGASGFIYDRILEENRSHTDESGEKNHFGIVDLLNQLFSKKLFITLVKDDEVGFILGAYSDRYKDYCSAGGIVFNFESSMGKREFIAKDQGGNQL